MPDFDETRKISDAPVASTRSVRPTGNEKTRLVRRAERLVEGGQPVGPAAQDGRTRLAGRPVAAADSAPSAAADTAERLVTGWLVVVSGPGRGDFAPIFDGMNSVGRDDDQATRIDFGDDMISRSEHAFITYDYMQRRFFIQQGGKPNLVRLNGAPVLQPAEMKSGDRISIGRTVMAFVPFCGDGFDWQAD
jgi:FHA domain